MFKRSTHLRLIGLLLIGLFCLTVNTYASPESRANPKADLDAPRVPGQLLVKFKQNVGSAHQAQAHALHRGSVVANIPQIGVQVVQLPTDKIGEALAGYQGYPGVVFAEPNYVGQLAMTPDDEYYATDQYGPQKIQADLAWDVTTGDSNVVVAVVDSGGDYNHPDLQGKLLAGYDFYNGDADPQDDNGHGTHVAGIAGAATNNTTGVAGVGFDTSLLPLKACDSWGNCYASTIAQGIIHAVDNGARVINVSVALTYDSSTLFDAVEYAWNNGAFLTAAAGNGTSGDPVWPAAYDHVMGVSATNQSDDRWSMSNYGDHVTVSAPGESIYSTNWDWDTGASNYSYRSGTSMAAPHVAGVAALLLAKNSGLTNTEMWNAIQSTADDLGPAGYDVYFGYGRVNAYKAVNAVPAGGGTSDPTATATTEPTATPTPEPTATSTTEPTATPTPTTQPTNTPTTEPTSTPTDQPTNTPTTEPTATSTAEPTATPTSAPATTMSVGDLDGTSANHGRNWTASVTILVEDANHSPVAGASVSGNWSGGYSGSASCTTDDNGQCSVASGNIHKKNGDTTFAVSDVSHATLTYDSSGNHDPDGDSNGTQITVYKPQL